MIREFDLPISHSSLERFWRQHGLTQNAVANTSENRTWLTSRHAGLCFSRSAPTPRISTRSHGTGCKPSGSTCPLFSTPRATSAAVCSSELSPRAVVPRPARSSPRASSSTWIAMASRSATWPGKPTTEVSSKAISLKLSAIANTSASHPPLTSITAMSKPFIASKKTSSSIRKTSPAAAISSPRPTPTSSFRPCSPQIPQGISEPLADHRAARSSLAPRTLFTPACLAGSLAQRLRGYDLPRLPSVIFRPCRCNS